MKRRPRKRPPLARIARRVSLSLTVGQDRLIKHSFIFKLCGRDYRKVIQFWMIRGIEQSVQLSGKPLVDLAKRLR